MAGNANVPQEQQSVLQQLWQQQYAQYSGRPMPVTTIQSAQAQAAHAQQPALAFPPPTYYAGQHIQPVAHGDQYGNGMGDGYVPQALVLYQNPYATAPFMANQSNSYAPSANSYNYGAQSFSISVNTWHHGHEVSQAPAYGWPGHYADWQGPQPSVYNSFYGESRADGGEPDTWESHRNHSRYASADSRRSSSYGWDKYRPTYAKSATTSHQSWDDALHQRPRRALVPGRPSTSDGCGYASHKAMSPLDSNAPYIEQYDEGIMKPVASLDDITVPSNMSHWRQRIASRIQWSMAAETIPDYRHPSGATSIKIEGGDTRGFQIKLEEFEQATAFGTIESLPQAQQPSKHLLSQTPTADDSTIFAVEHQAMAWPQISGDIARHLLEPDMQVVPAKSPSVDTTISEAVINVSQPDQVIKLTQPLSNTRIDTSPTAPEDAISQASPKLDARPAQAVAESAQSTRAGCHGEVTNKAHDGASPNKSVGIDSSATMETEAIQPAQEDDVVEDATEAEAIACLTTLAEVKHPQMMESKAPHPVQENDDIEVATEDNDTSPTTLAVIGSPRPVQSDITQANAVAESSRSAEGDLNTEFPGNAWDDTPSVDGWNDKPSDDWTPKGKRHRSRNKNWKKKSRDNHESQHFRSTTASTLVSPPSKRVKEESTPVPAQQARCEQPVRRERAALPITNGWGNFEAHIKQDDQNMVMKIKQDIQRNGGETFRPEIKESYKDRMGKAEITVHEKVGGELAVKQENSRYGAGGVVKLESRFSPEVVVKAG